MKNIIFTIFLEQEDFEHKKVNEFHENIEKYKDKLNNAREGYADYLNADYKIFNDKDWIKKFKDSLPINDYEAINFYKHHVMRELANEYDNVCYMDFDCFPNLKNVMHNTNENIFTLTDKFLCGKTPFSVINLGSKFWKKWEDYEYMRENYGVTQDTPAIKYWNQRALYEMFDIGNSNDNPDFEVYNTGLMCATSKQIKKLDYFGNFDYWIDRFTEMRNNEFYPMRYYFGYNNECFFNLKINLNKVPCHLEDGDWHSINFWEEQAFIYHEVGPTKIFDKYTCLGGAPYKYINELTKEEDAYSFLKNESIKLGDWNKLI